MKKLALLFCLIALSAGPAFATFSIVAIDRDTGEMGVAVASRYFSVGAVVPWAEADVGAVATQASVNVGYGPRALELLKEGLTAQQVLDRLFEQDTFPGKAGRQIAIVDRRGNVAVFTGEAASDWRGHRRGATYFVQGNILAGPEVVDAMAEAFENTTGELTERLYAALAAGDAAGSRHQSSSWERELAGTRTTTAMHTSTSMIIPTRSGSCAACLTSTTRPGCAVRCEKVIWTRRCFLLSG